MSIILHILNKLSNKSSFKLHLFQIVLPPVILNNPSMCDCSAPVPGREGLRALQRRLQPLAHHGRGLPHAAPQNGRPAGGGHREAQEGNRPQRRLPAPTVPTQRETGEGGQAERGGGQTKDQMRAGGGEGKGKGEARKRKIPPRHAFLEIECAP